MRSVFPLALLLATLCACGGQSKPVVTKVVMPDSVLSAEAYAHYLRGQLAAFEGDFELAITELRKAGQLAPSESIIALALVTTYFNAGQRVSAMKRVLYAQKRWPDSWAVWVKSGELHRSVDDHKKAASSYQRAIKLGAGGEAVRLAYAAQLIALGRLDEAEAQYRKLLTRGASAETQYQLALLLFRKKNHKAVIAHLAKATDLSPYDLRAWALLSASLSHIGESEKAKEALRRPFDRSGGNASISELLLTELLKLGEIEIANQLVATLDRDDLPIDTRIGMGHIYLRLGDFKTALQLASTLDQQVATSAAIAELRARALRALHRDAEAKQQLLAIKNEQSGYALTRSMLAELLADTGHFEEAKQTVATALVSQPDDADLVLSQASVAEKSNDLARAREILEAALRRHPHAQRPLFALAELESRSGNTARAIELISPLIAADPQDSSALNYVGYTLIEVQSARGRAKDLLRRALDLSPDSAFILDSYGWFFFRQGDLKRAAFYLEKASRLSPTEPELLLHLAELRWRQKDYKASSLLFTKAEDLALDRYLREKIRERRKAVQRSQP